MLGLIKKDLLLMKTNAKSLLVIFIIYLLMAINGNFDIVVMLPLFTSLTNSRSQQLVAVWSVV